MTEKRLLGNSNMDVFLHNGSTFVQRLEALVAAGSSSRFLHGHGNAITQPFYQPMEFAGETCNIDMDEGLQQPVKKRRLTELQHQLLEQNFESESKLEPERKVQIAKELGLQPRQVAIWFQNRRARWKTKHIEKEFEQLKSSYDTLKLDCDNLHKERNKLQAKVQSLTNILLQKENCIVQKELNHTNLFSDNLQKLDSDTENELKRLETNIVICKEEDHSPADSTVLDSKMTKIEDHGYTVMLETTSSSSAHESEISHVGEVDEVKVWEFLAPDNILCNFELQDGDQTLWIWPSI